MDQRPLILIPAGSSDGKTLAYDAATGLAKPTGYSNAEVDAALADLSGSIGGVESALTAHVEATNNPHGVTAEQVGAYTTTQVDGLISAITYSDVGAAAAEHLHTIGDVTGLQAALDGKANLSGATFTGGVAAKGSLTLNPAVEGPAAQWTLLAAGNSTITGAEAVYWTDTAVMVVGSGTSKVEIVSGNLYVDKSISESGQPLRERYARHFLNLESKDDLTTLDATIGDQATVLTGDANDPIHRYELMGDDLDDDTYATPAENPANWRRIVVLDADGEIKGPIINHTGTAATLDALTLRAGEISIPTDSGSLRMHDGSTPGGVPAGRWRYRNIVMGSIAADGGGYKYLPHTPGEHTYYQFFQSGPPSFIYQEVFTLPNDLVPGQMLSFFWFNYDMDVALRIPTGVLLMGKENGSGQYFVGSSGQYVALVLLCVGIDTESPNGPAYFVLKETGGTWGDAPSW